VRSYSVKVLKNEDIDSKYMLNREGRGAEKCKNSIEIGKVDEKIDFEEDYEEGDMDISSYESHNSRALYTAPNFNFRTWNTDSYKIPKRTSKNDVKELYNDDDDNDDYFLEFVDGEFQDEGFGNHHKGF
jgi:hypothetical protein